MPPEAKKKHITSADYISLIEQGVLGKRDRVELIHGKIIEMSPIGNAHGYAVSELHERLVLQLEGRAKVWSQSSIIMNDLSMPEPDLVILNKDRDPKTYPGPEDLFLIIEVAETSVEYDRDVKIPLYSAAGIPECWLVNLKNKTIECYRFPSGNEYQEKKIIYSGENAVFEALSIEIPVDSLLIDA